MRPGKKRTSTCDTSSDEEIAVDAVDDLIIAQQYATFSSLPKLNNNNKNTTEQQTSANKVTIFTPSIVDYSSSSEDEEDQDVKSPSETTDDESDVDLTEALSRMDAKEDWLDEEDDEVEKMKRHGRNKKQTSANTSAYDSYISNDAKNDVPVVSDPPIVYSIPNSKDIYLVGHVKSHIVDERIIVVESLSFHNNKPLDEGNKLLVSMKSIDDEPGSSTSFLSLGTIYEIFGPVSRLLYIIRLPSPPLKVISGTDSPLLIKDKGCEIQPKPTSDNGTNHTNDIQEVSTSIQSNDEKTNTIPPPIALDEIKYPKAEGNTTTGSLTLEKNNLSFQETQNAHDDSWSDGGRFTKSIRQKLAENDKISVFSFSKDTVWVDTHAIIQQSGKGCDVNEDEEGEELEFSDDEAEQRYYSRFKKQNTKKSIKNSSNYNPNSTQPSKNWGNPNPHFHQNNESSNSYSASGNSQSSFLPQRYPSSHSTSNHNLFRNDRSQQFHHPPARQNDYSFSGSTNFEAEAKTSNSAVKNHQDEDTVYYNFSQSM